MNGEESQGGFLICPREGAKPSMPLTSPWKISPNSECICESAQRTKTMFRLKSSCS